MFTIGCDPEFFVRKDGKLVSAHKLIPGTKRKPHPVEGGAVQVDGMALEFNTMPHSNFKEFNSNIDSILLQMKQLVGDGYEFDISPVAEFGEGYIKKQPIRARELGCDPDYNAYTGQPNPRPNGNMGIRTASGHIHIGWTKDMDPFDPGHFEACVMLTKQLDFCLGMSSAIWDGDKRRASMYGRLGTFRPKPYGVEYRVLSNAWLKDKEHRQFVFETAMLAAQRLMEGERWYQNCDDNEYFKTATSYAAQQTGWRFDGMRRKFPNITAKFEEVIVTSDSYNDYGMLNYLNPFLTEEEQNQADELAQGGPIGEINLNNLPRPRAA